jgi:hypothetical protein
MPVAGGAAVGAAGAATPLGQEMVPAPPPGSRNGHRCSNRSRCQRILRRGLR